MFRRRVFRIQLFGLCLRLTASRFQTISMLLVAGLAYAGSLIAAATYNGDCARAPGQPFTWERAMPPQAPGFPALTVLIGILLLLPPLTLIRKRLWRLFLAGTSILLVLMSAYYFKSAFGPFGCYNSGGMTDDYDAGGICEFIVYALVLILDYIILILYVMDRAAAAVRRWPKMPPPK